MQISIQANGFVLTEASRAYTEQSLKTALGWAGTRMRKLHVSLSDINGPRGGRDKRCLLEVRLKGLPEKVIEDTEVDLYLAIDRAAERAGRTLARRLDRQREFEPIARLEENAAQPDSLELERA